MNDAKVGQPHCTPHPLDGSPSDCGFQASSFLMLLFGSR